MKQILISAFFLMALTGCDEKQPDIGTAKLGDAPSVGQSASKTALFLPGGAGIDFGVEPVRDQSLKDSGGRDFRIIYYEFPDVSREQIDKSLSQILEGKGYVRMSYAVSKDYDAGVLYTKPGASSGVLVRYKQGVREGFEKLTAVTLSWDVK